MAVLTNVRIQEVLQLGLHYSHVERLLAALKMAQVETQTYKSVAPGVMPELAVCQQARLSRDPRFDGRFYIGVLTTGIYCRPICPARLPREDNVRYFPSAPAAQDAGFRPCLRCKPETAQSLPEWTLANDTVMRGMRMIEAGYLNDHRVADLACQLHMSERHLARLFNQQLGASPQSLARHVRARLAKHILTGITSSQTKLSDVAYHAGYRSISRFNAEIKATFCCTPGQLRRHHGEKRTSVVSLSLPLRMPYHFDWVFAYLRQRALMGVEEVLGGPGGWVYRRLIERNAAGAHWLQVRQVGNTLVADVPLVAEPIHSLLRRIRRVFDLNADGATLHDYLSADPRLGEWVAQAPGLRVPGAWDGFETAVRAILGQQVSVARGTALANKMIIQYGDGLFPRPDQLLGRQVAELGMPGRRGRAIVLLAQQVSQSQLRIDDTEDFDAVQAQLEALDGVGPWTANYIRMRALKDPNAFPDNDWVVMKQLGCSAARARQQAQAWQPWRAYALMYLWYAAGVQRAQTQGRR